MNCTICKNGVQQEGRVTVTLERGDSVIVNKNVPAMVCENCGEYTLDEKTAQKVMETGNRAFANNTEIEVLQFAA